MNPNDPNAKSAPIKGELEDGSESKTKKGMPTIVNVLIAAFCGFYLLNPGFGVFEFIPDGFPVIGNFDEATATAGLLYALSGMGLIPWSRN